MKKNYVAVIVMLVAILLLNSGCSTILSLATDHLSRDTQSTELQEEISEEAFSSETNETNTPNDRSETGTAEEKVVDTGMIQYSPVACGDEYTVAIKADGSLWGWGDSAGLFTEVGSYTAEPVHIMDDVAAVSGGALLSVIKTDGTLWVWGFQADDEPTYMMDNVTAVSSNGYSGLALKEDHSLWGYGVNRYGCVGDGTEEIRYEPVHIMDDVAQMWTTKFDSYAVKTDGTLWHWGDEVLTPECMDEGVVSVWAGSMHTLYKQEDGTLRYIAKVDGLNEEWYAMKDEPGALGASGILTIENVKMAASGTCVWVLLEDGTLLGWDSSDDQILGTSVDGPVFDPVTILESVEYVIAGGNMDYHTAAVRSDGTLWTWGFNKNGELGTGTAGEIGTESEKETVPVQVMDNIMLPRNRG